MANAKKTAKQSEPITPQEIIANEPEVKETVAEGQFNAETMNETIAALESEELDRAMEAPAADAKTWLKARKYGPLEAGGDEAAFLGKLLHLIQIGAWNHFQPLLEARLKAVKNDSAE